MFIDAASGAPVAREQTLKFATGTVLYNTPIRRPTSTRADYVAKRANLTVDGNPITTDQNGILTFPGTAAVQVTTRLEGPIAKVNNLAQGGPATATFTLNPSGTIVWNDENDQFVDAQLNGFIHTQIAKDHGLAIAPAMGWINQQLPVNVNENDQCNAYYDGASINFFRQSNNCENTGRLPDVVYHEFGHGFHHHAIILGSGDLDGALGEGVSDFFASSITGDPGMGRGFFYSNAPLRHIDPSNGEKTWPEDISGDTHQTGLIIAGALWDLRKLLEAKYDPATGASLTDDLFYGAMKNAVDIPSMYVETLATDDDDGNLENGTPNACEIVQAFGAHGLRTINVDSSTLSVEPPQQDGHEVTVKIEGLFSQCNGDAVDTAELSWRLRDDPTSALQPQTMAGGPLEFLGTIPEVAEGQVVNYNVNVRLLVGDSLTFPDNAADSMYEFFVGEVTPIYCTDFETDPELDGWSHGLLSGQPSEGADDWQWGSPAGFSGSGDPAEAYSGTKVYGNDLGHGNFNGLYQRDKVNYADTPIIDVSAYPDASIRLQYRRWLQVEDGHFDRASIFANGLQVWDNYASSSDQTATVHHTDWEWRFHDVDVTGQIQNGMMQVRFQIASDGGFQMGGWTLDDVCIVAYEGAPPINSICGNGSVEEGETCDDGNTDDGDGCSSTCQDDDGTGNVPEPGEPLKVDGGCGCEVAGATDTGGAPWQLGVLAFGLLGLLRRRRT